MESTKNSVPLKPQAFDQVYLSQYVDLDTFIKSMINSTTAITSEESRKKLIVQATSYSSLQQLFRSFILPEISNGNINHQEIEYLLFKDIDSHALKNVFLDKLDTTNSNLKNPQDIDNLLKSATNWINSTINSKSSSIGNGLMDVISRSAGYNFIMEMTQPKPKCITIPALFHKDNHIYTMFCILVIKNGKPETGIGTIDINLATKDVVTKYRNNVAISPNMPLTPSTKYFFTDRKLMTNFPKSFDFHAAYLFAVNTLVSSALRMHLEIHDTDKEHEAMYKMNQELVNKLLEEPQKYIRKKTKDLLEQQVSTTIKKISKIQGNDTVIENTTKRLFEIYLSLYISQRYTPTKLRNASKKIGAFGYPTILSFNGKNQGSSKVKSGNKAAPLVSNGLYFDIQASLNESKQVDTWRIAWFDSYIYDNEAITGGNVSQTTISVQNNEFRINFLAKKINNEMLTGVISKIKSYLD